MTFYVRKKGRGYDILVHGFWKTTLLKYEFVENISMCIEDYFQIKTNEYTGEVFKIDSTGECDISNKLACNLDEYLISMYESKLDEIELRILTQEKEDTF